MSSAMSSVLGGAMSMMTTAAPEPAAAEAGGQPRRLSVISEANYNSADELEGADKHFEDCQEAHDHEADVPVHLDQSDPSVGSESENRDNAQNEAHEDASSSQDAQDEAAPVEEKTAKAQKKKKKKKR